MTFNLSQASLQPFKSKKAAVFSLKLFNTNETICFSKLFRWTFAWVCLVSLQRELFSILYIAIKSDQLAVASLFVIRPLNFNIFILVILAFFQPVSYYKDLFRDE